MKKNNKLQRTRPWKDDPELGDMNDREYREEIFRSLQDDSIDPSHLPDPTLRRQYEDWLKKHK